MMNTNDLAIDKEILPLFDHTIHPLAGNVLHTLLHDVCASKEDIHYRQQIIKGFIANWPTLQAFTYPKADLVEVHRFLTNFGGMPSQWGLLFNKRKKQQLRSSLIQCRRVFERLQQYFLRLNVNEFPAPFNQNVQVVQEFLVREQLTDSAAFWECFFLFEAWFSISKTHVKSNFCFPLITDRFRLQNFYHPLLKHPVKNSLATHKNVLLLTGPNMSGKSTLLKAVSLCVYLARVGIGVPATACELPFFQTISIAINLKDDLQSGYSHFLSEIKTLKNVVIDASNGQRCFAVFDELFRGTNLEDAIEICKTTINGLTKFPQSIFIISTHLYQLKDLLDGQSIETHYIECRIEKNQPVFTYQLKTGWSTIKIGQLLFEQEGLNRLLSA